MGLTVRKVSSFVTGDRRTTIADVTFDNSYATGGESLTRAMLGLGLSLDSVHAASASGLIFSYDYVNQKLQAFYPSGGASAPAALGAPRATATAGATPVTSSGATVPVALAAGQALEVGSTTDLSTVTARVTAVGKGSGL